MGDISLYSSHDSGGLEGSPVGAQISSKKLKKTTTHIQNTCRLLKNKGTEIVKSL